MKKFLFIVLGLAFIAFVIIALPFILGFFSKDIDSVDDQDLLYTPRTVAEKNNAYYDLAKIEKVEGPKDKTTEDRILAHINGEEWDEGFIEEILAKNEKNLAYFEAATRKPDYQDPSYANLSTVNFFDITEPLPTNILPIARLNIIEAMQLTKQGEEQAALDKLFRMLALAETVQKAEGGLIKSLITIALEKLTLVGIQDIAQNSNLPKEVKASYAKQLEKFKDTHLEEAFKGEYLLFIATLNLINEGTRGLGAQTLSWLEMVSRRAPRFYIHPNRTKQMEAENLRKGITLVNTSCNELETINAEVERIAPDSPIALYVTENAVGKILYDAMAVQLKGANQKRCKIEKLFAETEKILTPSP